MWDGASLSIQTQSNWRVVCAKPSRIQILGRPIRRQIPGVDSSLQLKALLLAQNAIDVTLSLLLSFINQQIYLKRNLLHLFYRVLVDLLYLLLLFQKTSQFLHL